MVQYSVPSNRRPVYLCISNTGLGLLGVFIGKLGDVFNEYREQKFAHYRTAAIAGSVGGMILVFMDGKTQNSILNVYVHVLVLTPH